MLPLQYTYLVGSIFSFIPVTVFFFLRPDLRKAMMIMILLLTPYGLFSEYFWWTSDWWRPVTITHTRIGIEDLFLCISSAGAIVYLYPLFFHKVAKKIQKRTNAKGAILLLLLQIVLMSVFTTFFKTTSFYATTFSYLITLLILLYQRKDLLFPALVTGAIALLIVTPLYLILFAFTPTFVSQTWILSHLSRIFFLGIPIEDLVFYFVVGLFFGAFYWYFANEKLVSRR